MQIYSSLLLNRRIPHVCQNYGTLNIFAESKFEGAFISAEKNDVNREEREKMRRRKGRQKNGKKIWV